MKTTLSLVVLMVALVLGGCGPRWIVMKQATPNPMTPKSGFVVEKGTFDPGFRVGSKTEQQWMSEKKAETKESWDGDKVAMTEKFVEGFMGAKDNVVVANGGGTGVFSVRAKYVHYEPGYYAVVSSAPTQLEADVEFLDGSGTVVDVIHLTVKQSAMSSGDGARRCAAEIGALSAKYLKDRVGLK
jgi:hypothetical protein